MRLILCMVAGWRSWGNVLLLHYQSAAGSYRWLSVTELLLTQHLWPSMGCLLTAEDVDGRTIVAVPQ